MGEKTLTQMIDPLLKKYGLTMGTWRSKRDAIVRRMPEIYRPDYNELARVRGKQSGHYFKIAHLVGKIKRKKKDEVIVIPLDSWIFPLASATKTIKKAPTIKIKRYNSIDELSVDSSMYKLIGPAIEKADITKPFVGYDFAGISKSFEDIKVITPMELLKAYKLMKDKKIEIEYNYSSAPQSMLQGGIIGGKVGSLSEEGKMYSMLVANVPIVGTGQQKWNYFDLEFEGHGDCMKHIWRGMGHYGRTGKPDELIKHHGRKTKETYLCHHMVALYLSNFFRNEKNKISQNPFMILDHSVTHFNMQLDGVLREEVYFNGKEQKLKLRPLNDVERTQMIMKNIIMEKQLNNKECYSFSKDTKKRFYK